MEITDLIYSIMKYPKWAEFLQIMHRYRIKMTPDANDIVNIEIPPYIYRLDLTWEIGKVFGIDIAQNMLRGNAEYYMVGNSSFWFDRK